MTSERLIDLYDRMSKHSHYQVLARPLEKLIPTDGLRPRSRHEPERLEYLLRHLAFEGASLADVGGNTGYFTLELVDRGAGPALFFEGNRDHSDFVQEAVNVLHWEDRIKVVPEYMRFEEDLSKLDVDVCLLLNVLHHVGDDYGQDRVRSVASAKSNMLDTLDRLADHTRFLVLQIGFNWKGNVDLPLFDNGTKAEVLDFLEAGTQERWVIQHVGIAESPASGVEYRELTANNIERQDAMGEFLNRPLLIMKSKR